MSRNYFRSYGYTEGLNIHKFSQACLMSLSIPCRAVSHHEEMFLRHTGFSSNVMSFQHDHAISSHQIIKTYTISALQIAVFILCIQGSFSWN